MTAGTAADEAADADGTTRAPSSAPPATPTPSLIRRLLVVGGLVVLAVVAVVDLVVFAGARAGLEANLRALLDDRVAAVRAEATRVAEAGGDAETLARELQARGLRAVVTTPNGDRLVADPGSPVLAGGLPPAGGDVRREDDVSATVDVGEVQAGAEVEVFVDASGVRGALARLAVLQVLAAVLAVLLSVPLLTWAGRSALRPVHALVGAARRTAGGSRGERLRPDRPGTDLGQMAAAYDAVLDELEAGRAEVAKAERRTGVLETRWRQVLEVAPEAYVAVDGAGHVADWNRGSEALLGWSREEAVGMPAARILAPEHRESLLTFLAERPRQGPGGAGEPFLLEVVDRRGRQFPAECTVWGVERRGGTVVHTFLRDVTRRHEAERSAALLTAVVEGTSDAVITTDLDGRVLTWNAGATAMHGWTAAEAVGRHVSLVVPSERTAELEELTGRVARGERVGEVETERLTLGGTRLPVALRLSPVSGPDGELVAVSSIARDVTEQRWMAETLDRTLAALQGAAQEARASEESTRRFLADAAHQLRTPMAGIRACAETLLRGASSPEDADRLLATMVRETSRAARLISGLLQMARIDQGVPLAGGAVDVVALCAEEVERLSLLSPHLDVSLSVVTTPPGPLALDDAACREVLSNLGDNARRHATTSVVVEVAYVRDVDDREPVVRMAVRNDGPGLAEEQREQVFERFVSLDGRGGSGLGLPIARGLARTMGGDVRYEDGFVVELPAVPTSS